MTRNYLGKFHFFTRLPFCETEEPLRNESFNAETAPRWLQQLTLPNRQVTRSHRHPEHIVPALPIRNTSPEEISESSHGDQLTRTRCVREQRNACNPARCCT